MTHPILASACLVDQALKAVADTSPTFMSATDKAEALRELVRLESRLTELRLRIMADADDVAAGTGARDVADWLAREARLRPEDARADLRLALALDRARPEVGAALWAGEMTPPQAHVVVRALDDLPASVPAEVVGVAERALVDHAARFAPKQLARIGRHVLTVVAPQIADEAEARRLQAEESEARRRTRVSLRRLGDGTTRLSGILPDAVATRLAHCLEAFANPRREDSPADSDEGRSTDPSMHDPVARLPYPRRLGEAFGQLVEALDPRRLPLHGGDATTVVVTIPLASLQSGLGAGDLLGAGTVPSDAHHDPCAGAHLSAGEVRRLACNAGIVPAVLGGASEVLDLGRARRLFSAAQRRALLLRDRTCRAEGCDVPGTWAEAHHWLPWSSDGPTDLANGVLLCSHHHHRAHDPGYACDRMPDGDVRFARRT
ncbi:HNH endonuclease signature motif containing protein [Nocardioides zeicaulis]|uniref:DUF222 domain-containing protein n=1 Tax=Nocardioides zeicaulis TaxID=1776857 RepID=A0ABV6DXU1_9ACTN